MLLALGESLSSLGGIKNCRELMEQGLPKEAFSLLLSMDVGESGQPLFQEGVFT